MRAARGALALLAGALISTCPCGALAEGDDVRAHAGALFDEAERAFDRGDFLVAAAAFENAYRLLPRYDTLWNAALSWQRGGNLARSATALARYLNDAPPDAHDRTAAQARLESLALKLGRLELHAPKTLSLGVDGDSVDVSIVYVVPGSHVVSATGDREQSQRIEIKEGATLAVAFEAPGPSSPPMSARTSQLPVPARQTEVAPSPHSRSGWSPWVVVGEAAITVAAGAVTTWSGLQTLDALDAFNAHSTPSNLSAGQADQTRTNVLLATTGVLGTVTAVTALWLVDWHAATTRVGLGPAAFRVAWDF